MGFGEDRDMLLGASSNVVAVSDYESEHGPIRYILVHLTRKHRTAPQSATNMFSGKPEGHNTGKVTWYRIKLRQKGIYTGYMGHTMT